HLIAAFFLVLAVVFTLGIIGFSNGTAIEVYPKDAREVAVFDVVEGFGTTIGNTAYSLSKNPTIEVTATGFRSLRKTLQTSEVGGMVRFELSELPGQLRINTIPDSDKTSWYIDGRMVVVAAALNQDVSAGNHVVVIDNPYYLKKKIAVTMQRGKLLERSVELDRVTGQLNIKTLPSGANIRVNGDPVGNSPVSLKKQGGSYRVEVAHSDYQTITENIEITNNENLIERDYRLAQKDASLSVRVSPSGGRLLLDGKQVQSNAILPVKAGVDHSLIYLKDGYFSQSRTISVSSGLEKQVSFSLKPELGKVSFTSTPNATVLLNGKDVGQTPLSMELPALPHRLVLQRKGYRSYKQTLTPDSKSVQQVKVVLQTEKQARLSEAAKMVTNSVGMELKLFNPDDTFVMGAPRYEKGQRANEFLRTVKLTMPFYVSTHEVSRAQYGRFRKVQGAGNEPVTSISWIEAAQYCNWLSLQEKKTPFYDIRSGQLRGSNITSDGYRLLSEAEWEWLARKASKQQQTRFTWGDETIIPANSGNIADESAKGKVSYYVPNYSDGYAGLAPVGSYPPEKTGLYDLTGNVSEWVHDVYTLTPPAGKTVEIDPLGERSGDTHTVKGSNWRSGRMTELRASYREGEKAGRDDIGFRVARYVYGGMNGQ
ncbi:MAG TPA: SUMF1/EgtB/PvdO family nonheme iron enzyme, partial [Balneolales bacterium]|nr:SUMF1/EgtB/PvdO family nonheme iron enzyme [Balneolales bacterium]